MVATHPKRTLRLNSLNSAKLSKSDFYVTSTTQLRKVNWHQATVEVALIVAGILIALSVDSWRDEQQERQLEVDYLEELKQDFLANKRSLISSIEYQTRIVVTGDELLRMIQAGKFNEAPDEFASKVGELYFFGTWTPAIGTYDDLISSGRLLFLENRELRKQLSAFHRLLDRIQNMEELQAETYYQRHAPFLEGVQNTDHMTWLEDYRPPKIPFVVDTKPFATHQFWTLVVEWIYVHQDVVTSYRRASSQCDAILDLIESELAVKRDD